MKAIVHGHVNGKSATLGYVRLRGDKLVYAIHPRCPDRNVARSILRNAVARGMRYPDGPARFLEQMPAMDDGAYCRATFIEDKGKQTPPRGKGPEEPDGVSEAAALFRSEGLELPFVPSELAHRFRKRSPWC